MSVSEQALMFVLVTIMGAGIPGPADASLIAVGALAGEGTGGRERTEDEYRALFERSGLRLDQITGTRSPAPDQR